MSSEIGSSLGPGLALSKHLRTTAYARKMLVSFLKAAAEAAEQQEDQRLDLMLRQVEGWRRLLG